MRPLERLDDSGFYPPCFCVADGAVYAAIRYIVVYSQEPPAPLEHLPVPPDLAASGVAALEGQDFVRSGKRIKIGLSPLFRPMDSLSFTGQIAMELDMREPAIS